VTQPIAIRGGRLIDGIASEPFEKGALVIEQGRIVQVGSVDRLTVPRDARVIDAEGLTIMPGLIDAHTHVTYHATQPKAWCQEMEELEYLQALGYPPLEVLRAATATAAEALALDDTVGTLAPGKAGDVLLVDGDPANDVGVLRDKQRVVVILRAGEEQPRRERELPGATFNVIDALAREGLGVVVARR
jgi:imidazolonepropionase-like amidohydrolase